MTSYGFVESGQDVLCRIVGVEGEVRGGLGNLVNSKGLVRYDRYGERQTCVVRRVDFIDREEGRERSWG